MDLSRHEYPAMLDSLQPLEAIALLEDRLRHVGKVNNEIADWLQERRRVEELYVSALRKLATKQPPDDSSDLGIFTTPWQKFVTSAAALAESHHILAQKIEVDVEKPLRDFVSTSREMQAMSNMKGNLQSLAKDCDAAQKKSDKMKERGGKATAGKMAAATSEMETASSQWNAQAPYVFEALQAVDESRCNHLRDVLTQFQTHEVDQVEKTRKTAENTLNSLLSVDVADEVKTFRLRSTGTSSGGRRRSDRRMSLTRSQPSNTLTPPPVITGGDERASQGSIDAPEEKKSRLGGLKRLGTVMGRRRQSTQPTYAQSPAAKKSSGSNLAVTAASNGERPVPSRGGSSSQPEPPPVIPEILPPSNETAAPAATQQRGITLFDEPIYVEDSITPVNNSTVNGVRSQTDPVSFPETTSNDVLPPTLPQPTATTTVPTIEPATLSTTEPATMAPMDPITLAEQEAASVSESSASQLKVDIRNDPIAEERADAESAMASMANTLRAQAAVPRRSATNRGRRDVRNTVFVPSVGSEPQTFEQPNPIASPSPPLASPMIAPPMQSSSPPLYSSQLPHRPSVSEDQGASDAQSIKSSRSAGTLRPIVRHPDLVQPGLNSSIVETVSAWFEQGQITRALVVGELALAYNQGIAATSPNESIRLENFAALEKVAPNPAFVSQLSFDVPGEYSIDLGGIAGRTAVAFKYQVHVSESNLARQAPLILTPSWKVEPAQTSVILAYTMNPEFTVPVTLSNVVLAVYLDTGTNDSGAQTGKPTACLTKPTGTFSKERSMVQWKLDEVTFTPGSQPQRVLARFTTEGQARAGRVEARWEIGGMASAGLGSGLSVSRLEGVGGGASDPFADDENLPEAKVWTPVESVRRLASGTYTAT